MEKDPKDTGADRGSDEKAPVKGLTLPPKQLSELRRTVSNTKLKAEDILAALRRRSTLPPPQEEASEDEAKKEDEQEEKKPE